MGTGVAVFGGIVGIAMEAFPSAIVGAVTGIAPCGATRPVSGTPNPTAATDGGGMGRPLASKTLPPTPTLLGGG